MIPHSEIHGYGDDSIESFCQRHVPHASVWSRIDWWAALGMACILMSGAGMGVSLWIIWCCIHGAK